MNRISLAGEWSVRLPDGQTYPAVLPGTLDENRIGHPDSGSNQWHPDADLGNAEDLQGSSVILTRLTRVVTYEGPAVFERTLTLDIPQNTRAFVTVERSRELTLTCNGHAAPPAAPGTLSTPYRFEVTRFLRQGTNTFTFCCDNSYPHWPKNDIVYSSAATDETQTNWNGLLGDCFMEWQTPNFIRAVRVTSTLAYADVTVELDCQTAYRGSLRLQSDAFAQPLETVLNLPAGVHELRYTRLPQCADCRRWDFGEGNLYAVTAHADGMEAYTIRFGVRSFGADAGRLALNGRPIFLRSEANCCVFPQAGHMPLDTGSWLSVLQTYRSYGVNCMRFHSHCPPDAAFTAADQLGMLMQPELSHWNPQNALESDESFAYYQLELRQILRTYANHPSFVMLTFGNELHTGALGHARMDKMLAAAQALDATRLYADSSNPHYGQLPPDANSDFYTSSSYLQHMLRATSAQMLGYLNNRYPSAAVNYTVEMAALRQDYGKPVFSFEVGQYEVLPDFTEIEQFTGVTRADNLAHVRSRVEAAGLMAAWRRRVEATGELALLGYREEVEAVLRTPALSGISLLGLQDFPGQGTALVGMLNAHLQPKPFSFADPKRFAAFFTDVLPLALLPRYTYRQNERLAAQISLANYGKADLPIPAKIAITADGSVIAEAVFPETLYKAGQLTTVGTVDFPLRAVPAPRKLQLRITAGEAENSYPIWVYPEVMQTAVAGVSVTACVQEALPLLRAGKTVLLDPPADEAHLPQSIQAQFTTDFWSVGTFPRQSGFMGCLVDPGHPVFRGFPTSFHTDWQWWPLCRGRAMVLPPGFEPLITGIDCYARLRRLGLLLEARVGGGRLMLSSMGLHEHQQYPEAQAMLKSILSYMASDDYNPTQTVTEAQLQAWVR